MKIMKKTHAAQKYKRQLVFLLFVTGKYRYSTKHVTASIGATGAVVSAAATVETVGALTAVNGVSELGEAATGHNFVRDDVFRGNEKAYDVYSNTTAAVAENRHYF